MASMKFDFICINQKVVKPFIICFDETISLMECGNNTHTKKVISEKSLISFSTLYPSTANISKKIKSSSVRSFFDDTHTKNFKTAKIFL